MIDTFIQEAYAYHDTESERLAAELENINLQKLSPDQAGDFLKLSNHTIGEHLGQWARALALAESVCGLIALQKSGSVAWAQLAAVRYVEADYNGAQLAEMASVGNSSDNTLVAYIQVKLSIVVLLVGKQCISEAASLLQSAMSLADEKEDQLTHIFAVSNNNIATKLLDFETRDAAVTGLMQLSANSAYFYWQICGNWENKERALYLLSLVENAVGNYVVALEHAEAALKIIADNGGEEVDEAFICLSMVSALSALGKDEDANQLLLRADKLAGSWQEDGLSDWYQNERSKALG